MQSNAVNNMKTTLVVLSDIFNGAFLRKKLTSKSH